MFFTQWNLNILNSILWMLKNCKQTKTYACQCRKVAASRSSSLIRVNTVCHSILDTTVWIFFFRHFRIITAVFRLSDFFYFYHKTLTSWLSWCVSHLRQRKTRGPWATTLTWIYSYEGYIQPKYCKCCMQENLAFQLPWPPIQISGLDKIHMVGRGLLQKHFSKTFVKISAVTQK